VILGIAVVPKLKGAINSMVLLLLIGFALFASAGRLDVPAFWLYLAVFAAVCAVGLIVVDSDLVEERIRPGGKRPPAAIFLLPLLPLAHWVVAGLDRGRLHWSDTVPTWLNLIAMGLFAASWSLVVWVGRVNRFASPMFSPVYRGRAEIALRCSGAYGVAIERDVLGRTFTAQLSSAVRRQVRALLYGVAAEPHHPPLGGRLPSRGHIRTRIRALRPRVSRACSRNALRKTRHRIWPTETDLEILRFVCGFETPRPSGAPQMPRVSALFARNMKYLQKQRLAGWGSWIRLELSALIQKGKFVRPSRQRGVRGRSSEATSIHLVISLV
jgi:hypothetical protein